MALSSHQRQHLKALAHLLRPLVQIGNAGVSEGVFAAIAAALEQHELIKVQMPKLDAASEREAMAAQLASGSGAELVQVLGRMVVLYLRRKKDMPGKSRIELPKG